MSSFALAPRPFLASLGLAAAFAPLASAQTASDPNEGLRLATDPATGAWTLSWWGRPGRIYSIEHSGDLFAWRPLPTFDAGADETISYGIGVTGDRFFARVRSIEATLAQFETGDYDGDGLSNAFEAAAGLNPFAKDSDFDGLTDDYETAFGLNPLSDDSIDDLDGDGVPNQEDARPNNGSVGRLMVSINEPSEGSAQ
jgi:hypothetical protein